MSEFGPGDAFARLRPPDVSEPGAIRGPGSRALRSPAEGAGGWPGQEGRPPRCGPGCFAGKPLGDRVIGPPGGPASRYSNDWRGATAPRPVNGTR